MKLTLFAILVFTLHVSASVYSQTKKFDLSFKNVSVKEVFKAIESRSDFRFFYNDELSDVNRLVTVDFENMKVEDVLSKLFNKSEVTYKVLENNLIVITPSGLVSQKQTVTGTVTDASTGEPLPGTNVTIEGTTQGTITDVSGKYSLDVPSPNNILIFSLVGYNSERVQVTGKTIIDMQLVTDIKKLEEVVVIGYGTRAKKDVTSSIATVSSDNISKTSSSSAEYSLMGRMAGVSVSGSTGDPLSRPTIRIRGVNTWGVADPIYVIDGVPVTETGAGADAQADGRFATIRGNINIMTLIDPNDIESISVLKDAAAAAVYGVRAANGVILITTKQGKKGDKPLLEFNARYGVQNVRNVYDVMDAQQLIKFKQDAYLASSTLKDDQANWNELSPVNPNYVGNITKTADWQNAGLNKNAQTQEYNLRLSGGTDKSTYSLSGGYASNEGMLLGKTMERYSMATNVTSQLSKWLKVGGNYRLAYVKGRDNDLQGFNLRDLSQVPSWQPIYEEGGYLGYASIFTLNSDGLTGTGNRWASDQKPNVLGALASVDNTYGEFRNLGSAYIEFEPINGLKFKGTVSGDYYKRYTEKFIDYEGWQFGDQNTDHSSAVTYPNSVGSLNQSIDENFNLIKEFSVNYVKALGEHHIDVLFNAMDQQYNFKGFGGTGYAMTTKDKGPRFVGNQEDKNTNLQTDVMRNALQGYLGRLSYNYKSKYYLDLTLRRDGSSKFSKDNQWGTFPGMSAAWRISAESFMQGITWINDLKLRVGRGSLGNMEVRDLAFAYIVNPNPAYSWGYSGDGIGIYGAGAAITDMANPDLSWEKTTTNNFGLDFTLLKGLSGSIEYYYKLTDGIIQQINLPPSLGYKNTPFVNLAQVSNKGIEIVLNYENSIGEFKYSIGGNLTTVKNRVEKTYNDLRYSTSAGLVEEGKTIGYERGYKFDGIYQSQEDADKREAEVIDNSRSQKVVAGDAYFKDINGAPSGDFKYETPVSDGKLDSYDQAFLWDNIPPYYYGINLGLNWKGIDFSALFNGTGGIYGHWDGLMGMGSRSNGTLVSAYDSWTPENHSSWLPRNVFGDPNSSLRSSDRDKQSRSYLRLQSVQLGYTLPKSVYSLMGNAISNLRVYVGANDILTFTKWQGLNPDGSDVMPYVVNFGINARF